MAKRDADLLRDLSHLPRPDEVRQTNSERLDVLERVCVLLEQRVADLEIRVRDPR